MYRLPEMLRPQLASPLGPVLPGAEAAKEASKSRVVATVGDVTTATFLEQGLRPRVMVVDNRTKRGSFPHAVRERIPPGTPVVQVANPPARITDELWDACAAGIAGKAPVLIEVQGEEDLAVLPIALLAPTGTVVAYGQPDQGVVLLQVNDEARDRVRALLKQMEGP
jgi:GTP-dependent dephospho-CoA kinase